MAVPTWRHPQRGGLLKGLLIIGSMISFYCTCLVTLELKENSTTCLFNILFPNSRKPPASVLEGNLHIIRFNLKTSEGNPFITFLDKLPRDQLQGPEALDHWKQPVLWLECVIL